MTDSTRVALAIVTAGCLMVAAAGVAGCGNLRSKLGPTGGTAGGTLGGASGLGGQPPGGQSGHGGQPAAGTGGAAGYGGSPVAAGAGGNGGSPIDGGDVTDGGVADAASDAPAGAGGAGGAGGRPGAGGPGGGSGVSGAPGPANGASCTEDAQCGSGHCVDHVCCNDACAGQCEACDVDQAHLGTCTPVPSAQQPHGKRAACAGAGICGGACDGGLRSLCAYPAASTSCRAQSCAGGVKTRAAVCDGMGACGAVATVSCAQGCAGTDCLGACASDADCVMAGNRPYCDGGTCTALKPNGRGCTQAAECTSNHCADGVCCSSDCTGQCFSCNETGSPGICQHIRGAPRGARAGCGGNDACAGSCDGTNDTCQYPSSSTSCGTASCAAAMVTPVGACNGAGSCARGTLPCSTAYCASNTACGPCGSDTDCGPNRWCDHATNGGTCTDAKPDGASCSPGSSAQCLHGHCVANASGTGGTCCASACSGAAPHCNATGTGCTCACAINSVCDASTGACCMPNSCYFNAPACNDGRFNCDPGCGLPAPKTNCGCTSTGCCGDVCCAGGCSNGICTGSHASCP